MAKYTDIAKNKVKIEFEISREAFEKGMQEAYLKNKSRFQVPGFRKGKAPRAVLEKYYGEGLFFEEGFENAFPDAYSEAIKELGLQIVSRPENVDIATLEDGQPLKVTAEAYVKPEVELCEYKGMEVEFEDVPLSAEAVDNEIESTRQSNARFETVEREAQNGDRVILDYSGSIDGVKFEGGTAEGQSLDLGSNTFIPGFEEQIVGMKAGDEKDINVTFPENYGEAKLAGKPAVFAIKVSDVKEKIVPELNDEFVQDVSEFDTVEEYKADVAAKLEKQNADQNKMRKESAVIEAIVDKCTVDIPAPMVENAIDQEIQEMQYNLSYQGLDMEQYLKYMGQTITQLRDTIRTSCERRVKTQLVLDAIRANEKIEASEDALNDLFKEFADAQNKSIDEIKAEIDEDSMEYFKSRASFEALGDFLIANSTFKAPEKKEEEAVEA